MSRDRRRQLGVAALSWGCGAGLQGGPAIPLLVAFSSIALFLAAQAVRIYLALPSREAICRRRLRLFAAAAGAVFVATAGLLAAPAPDRWSFFSASIPGLVEAALAVFQAVGRRSFRVLLQAAALSSTGPLVLLATLDPADPRVWVLWAGSALVFLAARPGVATALNGAGSRGEPAPEVGS